MLNRFKWVILFSAFALLIISPATSFAWRYEDGYWDYHGSGRDYSYSQYIDMRYSSGYADYTTLGPDFVDDPSYTTYVPPHAILPAPVQPMTPVPAQAVPDEFIVNVPNDHGGYTAVVIKRSGNGFTGPQGEYYPEFPKVFQLKIMYGK